MATFGDISPRTAAFAAARLLRRAIPFQSMARFGQLHTIPRNKSLKVKFRRYSGFAPTTVPLVEGVTPAPTNITPVDVTAVLQQYGQRTVVTDVIADAHEDPVLQEVTGILGEVAGQTQELVVFNALRAGTNVMFPSAAISSRTQVNLAVSGFMLDRVIRQLKRQNATPITQMLAATDKVSTQAIRPSFVTFCHPDLQIGLEGIQGYVPAANYSTAQYLGDQSDGSFYELGSYKELRFVTSTLYSPFLAAGAAVAAGTFLSNGANQAGPCDVYPLITVGKDAYAVMALAGANAITPMVVNPKPCDSDPLGQRGHVAFKMYSAAAILNDAWMVRSECAVAV